MHFRKKSEELRTKVNDKYLIYTKIFPENTGEVIKAGKNEINVAFKFPDGKIRAFKIKSGLLKT